MKNQITYSARPIFLKNLLLAIVIGLLPFLGSRTLNAQTPQYYVSNTSGGNVYPFGSSAGNKTQWLYYASDFTGTPTSGNITKIYVKASSVYAASTPYTNFTVKIGTTTLTQFTSATYETGLTTAIPAQTFTISGVTQGQWVGITLDNPIYYDGTSNFIVEISQTAYNNQGFVIYQDNASNNRRIYGVAGNSTGNGYDTGFPDFGFDMGTAVDCNAASFPSSVTATANPESACVTNGLVNLSMDSTFNYTGVTYQWQKSPNGLTNWTNVGSPLSISPDKAVTLTTQTWFRCQVLCHNTTVLTSNSVHILIVDPQITATHDTLRCGPGSVQLSASSSVGTVVKWFDEEQGGTLLHEGDTFTTPSLSQTDTFWVEAGQSGASGTPDSAWLGTGTGNFVNVNPFYTYAQGDKLQYLIKASELQALGFTAGTINSLTFECGNGTPLAMNNFQLKMGETNITNLTTTWETGLTTVYSNASYMPQLGYNRFDLTAPFQWDGTSNIVVETCFNNTSAGSTYLTVKFSYPGFTAAHYAYENGNSNFCVSPGGTTNYTNTSRANMQFTMTHGCSSNRQPVIAHIDLGPEVNLGNDTTLCPGVAGFTLDAGNPGATYLWIPYATTQTIQATTTGTYKVFVTNSNNCTNSDIIHISAGIQPVDSLPLTRNLCVGDTITLNAANAGSTYSWNTGDTSRTIQVHNPGNYSVAITSIDKCVINSQTQVISRPLPVTHLGKDTIICGTDNILLDAGNPGYTYAWNTGAYTQTIVTTDSGLYYVLITTPYGCQATDSFHLAFWPPPRVDGFNFIPQFYHQLGEVAFSILNQRNVTRVHWDFGDGSQGSTSFNPTHNYPVNGGAFSVTLTVYNDCGSYSVTLPIEINTETGVVSFKDNQSEIKVYPNPARDFLNVESQNKGRIQQVLIYDGIGRVVGQKQYGKPGEEKIRINTSGLSSGIYLLRIQTNDGWKIKKFDLKH